MGMYTGVRFKTQLTPEARKVIEWCQEDRWSRGWEQAAAHFHLAWIDEWVNFRRCNFIPWGGVCYLQHWVDNDGYSKLDGENWEVLCSLKNYEGEIDYFLEKILPRMIIKSTEVEVRYESSDSSHFYYVKPEEV